MEEMRRFNKKRLRSLGKYLSLCFVVLLAASILFVVKPSDAQTPLPSYIPEPTYPTPSIPEFTVQLTGPSFTKPTTYILNDSNGQIEAQIGYTNDYSSVRTTVKNQPFTSFDSGFNGPVSLMYNIRIKNHQTTEGWTEVYSAYDGYPSQSSGGSTTELSFSIQAVKGFGSIAGSQIDIQVQAMIGTVHRMIVGGGAPWFLDGQVSGWRNTQTISIPPNVPLSSTSSSPFPTGASNVTPTAIPNATSSDLLAIVVVAFVVISLLLTAIAYLLYYIRKQKIT
jgi:hypothetical protein